jgi:hypothetical protein
LPFWGAFLLTNSLRVSRSVSKISGTRLLCPMETGSYNREFFRVQQQSSPKFTARPWNTVILLVSNVGNGVSISGNFCHGTGNFWRISGNILARESANSMARQRGNWRPKSCLMARARPSFLYPDYSAYPVVQLSNSTTSPRADSPGAGRTMMATDLGEPRYALMCLVSG